MQSDIHTKKKGTVDIFDEYCPLRFLNNIKDSDSEKLVSEKIDNFIINYDVSIFYSEKMKRKIDDAKSIVDKKWKQKESFSNSDLINFIDNKRISEKESQVDKVIKPIIKKTDKQLKLF
jgi:hypothetical protein